jgi:hypothetical protein
MATPQQGVTPEFAVAFRDLMLDGIIRELPITKKVLAAVPDAKSDYRPDPHARTAWELAWHLANTDVQFLDGIGDLKFSMNIPESKPKIIAELIDWYEKNFTRAADKVCSLTPEQLGYAGRFHGRIQLPGSVLSGIPQQSQHPPSRRACHLSASHGLQGSFNLWRQLRRAIPGARLKNCCVASCSKETAPRRALYLLNEKQTQFRPSSSVRPRGFARDNAETCGPP